MQKALIETLAKIRIISGTKSSGLSHDQPVNTKDKFRNRIKSAAKESPGNPTQVQLPINDQKVEKELEFLQDMIELLADKCRPNESYPQVNAILDTVVQSFKDEAGIVESYEKNKKLYRYLESKWKKDKEEFQEKLLKCDGKIFDLENEIKEVEVENSIKAQLVVKWEHARLEHTEGRYQEKKLEFEKRIRKANSDYDKELRIFNEVETFTRNEIERLNGLIKEWEDRYTRECLELDDAIKAAKVRIEVTQDRIQSLREVFIRRNIEIQSYLQQKAKMEEARKLEKLKWDSAVRIQAWWRGTMFRNGLGPYRKKKKAPKKSSKGGKNK